MDANDPIIAPFHVAVGRGGKQHKHARGVCAILCDHVFDADHIATRFRHFVAVFVDNTLVKYMGERFGKVDEADVVQKVCDKSGIHQMSYGVFFATNVVCNRQPIFYGLRVTYLGVTLGRGET